MKQLTVNDVKKEAYNFLATYKKVYNDKEKRQELLKIANVNDIKFIGKYCIRVSDVAEAVANLLEVDKQKVKTTLLNNTNTSLSKVNFNKKYGEYYYYLGDI